MEGGAEHPRGRQSLQRQHSPVQVHVLFGSVAGTTNTGTDDLRMTPAETLPTTKSNNLPRPWEPMTITSALSLSAC